jgi:hypothetical protein
MWCSTSSLSFSGSESLLELELEVVSPGGLVNVLGRRTKPKRRIQVKNFATRVWQSKSFFLRWRSSASGTLGVGAAGTAGVAVGTVESSPPFSGSGVVGAGVESEGTIGGFSLDGGVETGATCEFVTGAEASTLAVAVAVAPLSGCFSCSAEKQGVRVSGIWNCRKRGRD